MPTVVSIANMLLLLVDVAIKFIIREHFQRPFYQCVENNNVIF